MKTCEWLNHGAAEVKQITLPDGNKIDCCEDCKETAIAQTKAVLKEQNNTRYDKE